VEPRQHQTKRLPLHFCMTGGLGELSQARVLHVVALGLLCWHSDLTAAVGGTSLLEATGWAGLILCQIPPWLSSNVQQCAVNLVVSTVYCLHYYLLAESSFSSAALLQIVMGVRCVLAVSEQGQSARPRTGGREGGREGAGAWDGACEGVWEGARSLARMS
jgi:hypothetical protein